jgi:hypothetical protein
MIQRVMRTWKIMKEVVQDLTAPMKMLKKCRVWCIQVDISESELSVQLNLDKEAVVQQLDSHHDNVPARVVPGLKIDY